METELLATISRRPVAHMPVKAPRDRISESFRKLVVLLDEQFVTLGQLLLINQLESLKVMFSSMCSLVDIVDIVFND